ncbi:tyrosine-type recombinase/integrase [Umezawaea sp. NPDC059074]|uniref:tyrosine-type recombinase/integrase n=1 Tax=Umezawaea sp. NPDC059074 TaxID=3346716 RepID=UPI0036A7398F
MRYKVRYVDPAGEERAKSFPDRQLGAADDFLLKVESEKRTGTYLDPEGGKITFRAYADAWLIDQAFDGSTRNAVERRLNKLVYPYLGDREIGLILPTNIRAWLRALQQKKLAGGTRAVAFVHVSAVFSAAIDDKKIAENPCKAKSVTRPQPDKRKIVPWTVGKVAAVRAELSEKYKIVVPLGAGCGLRQGEVFGLSPEDIDREEKVLHIVRQVRVVDNVQVFAPPKGGKERDVPLPGSVLRDLDAYMAQFPPTQITLPWKEVDGEPETVSLILVNQYGKPIRRDGFNQYVWTPALGRAKVARTLRQDGMHALRHFYASMLLDAGESIKALAEWLGHADPAFTMRVYTHLLPSSSARARKVVDRVLAGEADANDHDPQTDDEADGLSDNPDGL